MSREDLARRAVAAWQKCRLDWMPGMACRNGDGFGFIVLNVDTKGRLLLWNPPWSSETRLFPSGSVLPDMDAHATLGCIEHGMLPAAWGLNAIVRVMVSGGIASIEVFSTVGGGRVFHVEDEPIAEALVACLEAAAERRQS